MQPEAAKTSKPTRSRRAPALKLGFLGSLLLAVAGGVGFGLAFRSHPDPFLGWFHLLPLFVFLRVPSSWRRASLLALIFGAVGWWTAIPWIQPTLVTFGALPPWLATLLQGVLCLYLGAYCALFVMFGRYVLRQREPGLFDLAVLPAGWVALEWARTYCITGFPWNLEGYAWVAVPGALPLTAWIGSYGLSYLVVFANCSLWLAAVRRRWEWAAIGLLLPLLVLPMAARQGQRLVAETASEDRLEVRLVQPNLPILTGATRSDYAEQYRRLLDLTWHYCDGSGALIVWPESAAFPYSYQGGGRLRTDLETLARAGCPVLLNTPRWPDLGADERVFNSILLVEKERRSWYDKQHLVPYGEYAPLSQLLPFIGHLARNAGQFSAGKKLELVDFGGESLGLSICFEITFPAEVAKRSRLGATVLLTTTNDAWYGDTFAPWQHLRAARFRAAENQKPLLRAALTGISAVIREDGSIASLLGVGEEGVLSVAVAGSPGVSPYARVPWLVPLLSTLVALGAIGFAKRRASSATAALKRNTRGPGQGQGEHP